MKLIVERNFRAIDQCGYSVGNDSLACGQTFVHDVRFAVEGGLDRNDALFHRAVFNDIYQYFVLLCKRGLLRYQYDAVVTCRDCDFPAHPAAQNAFFVGKLGAETDASGGDVHYSGDGFDSSLAGIGRSVGKDEGNFRSVFQFLGLGIAFETSEKFGKRFFV